MMDEVPSTPAELQVPLQGVVFNHVHPEYRHRGAARWVPRTWSESRRRSRALGRGARGVVHDPPPHRLTAVSRETSHSGTAGRILADASETFGLSAIRLWEARSLSSASCPSTAISNHGSTTPSPATWTSSRSFQKSSPTQCASRHFRPATPPMSSSWRPPGCIGWSWSPLIGACVMKRSPLFLLIAVLGCAAPASQLVRPSTQLQTREFQTRTYETTDTPMVMKALLNVLQDD